MSNRSRLSDYKRHTTGERIDHARQIARDNVARLKAQKLEKEQRRREQELTAYKAGFLTAPLSESLLPE